jgi:hypothetical protein
LLKLIQELISRHTDAEVLEEAARCLAYLCEEDNPTYSRCNITRSAVLDSLVDSFATHMRQVEALAEVDDAELRPLVVSLKRLAALATCHDISAYETLIKATITVLKWVNDNEGFAHEFFTSALSLARSIISWNLKNLCVEAEEAAGRTLNEDNDETQQSVISRDQVEFLAKLSRKYYKICSKLLVNDNPLVEQEAFFELCDLFLLFNMHLGDVHAELRPLILECTTNDIYNLSVYVMNHVFTPEALTERPDTAINIEKLHTRRSLLAAFAKLVCYNCVPVKFAAEILRGYARYASSYGDLIKSLLATCRDISKVNTARTIALALQREYSEAVFSLQQRVANDATGDTTIQSEAASTVAAAAADVRLDRGSQEFGALRELAHKFCLSFGPDASVKSREAIVAIHQEALKFALEPVADQPVPKSHQAPTNLPFLEVVIEFSSRLSANDKKLV